MEQQQIQRGSVTQFRTDEPQMYRVICHNDDFTSMEFVVMVLKTVFFKNDVDAERLMMQVHKEGQAIVGVYTKDIAMSKVQKTVRMARDEGYPLRLTYELDS